PAELAAPPVLPSWREVAIAAAVAPLIAAPDRSHDAGRIHSHGVAAVFAGDIAADRVASRATQHDAAHSRRGLAAAVPAFTADDAAGNGADNRAGSTILLLAFAAVIVAGRGGARPPDGKRSDGEHHDTDCFAQHAVSLRPTRQQP